MYEESTSDKVMALTCTLTNKLSPEEVCMKLDFLSFHGGQCLIGPGHNVCAILKLILYYHPAG